MLITISATKILYHRTHINSAIEILRTNQFMLSQASSSVSDKSVNEGAQYYLSCARSKHGDATKLDANRYVVLVLDGQKLGERYRVAPVDYWGPEYQGLKDEMEDRVLSSKQSIPKAKSYITEAHVLIDNFDDIERDQLKRFLLEAKRAKIKTFVYTDLPSAKALDKRKAKSIKDLDLRVSKEHLTRKRYYRPDRSYLKPYYQLLIIPKGKALPKECERTLMKASNYIHDFVNGLSADMHNARSDKKGKDYGYIRKITEFMEKNNIKTFNELADYIADKWRDQ